MTGRPPSPPTPTSPQSTAPESAESSHVTTAQLAAGIEDAVGCRLDETSLEAFLVQLDRNDYVEWVAVTRTGDYVWDLSESPDRIADAIAAAVAERLRSWLGDD